jgi:hypothetical protein
MCAEKFDPIVIVAFLVGCCTWPLILRRWSLSRALTRRHLFVGANLIAAIP